MKINKMNYEAFVMDYIEGSLDEATQKSMEDFLQQNTDVQAEVMDIQRMEFPKLTPIHYPDKSDLYKSQRSYLWPILSIAATLLLLIFVALPLYNSVDISDPEEKVVTTLPKELPNDPETGPIETKNATPSEPDDQPDFKPPTEQEMLAQNIITPNKPTPETTPDNPLIPVIRTPEDATVELNKSKEVAIMEIDPLIEPTNTEKIDQALNKVKEIAALSTISSLDFSVKPLYPTTIIDLQLLELENSEVVASNTSKLKKIYQKIQPEVFDNKSLGSIKEALVPEALADLFSNRTKVD